MAVERSVAAIGIAAHEVAHAYGHLVYVANAGTAGSAGGGEFRPTNAAQLYVTNAHDGANAGTAHSPSSGARR